MEPSEAGQAIAGDRARGNALAVDAARSSRVACAPRAGFCIALIVVAVAAGALRLAVLAAIALAVAGPVAALSAVLLAVVSPSLLMDGSYARPDALVILLSLVLLWVYLQRARSPRGWIAIAGLLVDFLVSIKISSLVYGVLLPAVFRLESRDSARHMKPADEGPVDAQAAGGAADSRARGSDACGDIRWDWHQG